MRQKAIFFRCSKQKLVWHVNVQTTIFAHREKTFALTRNAPDFCKTMFLKTFTTVFLTVFLAEIGDKTQLATMLFAADNKVNNLHVFLGSAAALVVAAAIGVFAGTLVGRYVPVKYLHYAAGTGFIAIGIWTLVRS